MSYTLYGWGRPPSRRETRGILTERTILVQTLHPRFPEARSVFPPCTFGLYAGGGGPTGGEHSRPVIVAGAPTITLESGASYPSGRTQRWIVHLRIGDVIRVGDEVWACDAHAEEDYTRLRLATLRAALASQESEIARAKREGWYDGHTKWRTPSMDVTAESSRRDIAEADGWLRSGASDALEDAARV